MRTILYQPVYINPQAYFVFPSLYHIEKGDSYVEPAVYTGQLLIDVVDGSASSVIIKDTKQVDFSDYAGKHIRISQYTDEGAVVLGEWLIPSNQVYLDSHLVDAWFMSGYSNDNPPDSISGYKGHELVLKNFAFTSNSGFGGSVDHSGGNDEGKAASSYEGSLVFDGVDDYAVCYNMPIQTDYTVICRRQIININNSSAVASKRTYPNDIGFFGAFVIERVTANGSKALYSFGKDNAVNSFDSNQIIYQSKTAYNGKNLVAGDSSDTNILSLGANAYNLNLGRCQEFSNVAIYYFALYDKSLTPDEIEQEKIKLNEIWTKRLNG